MTQTLTIDPRLATPPVIEPARWLSIRGTRPILRTRWVLVVSGLLIVLALLTGVALALWNAKPDYWTKQEAALLQLDPQEKANRAHQFWGGVMDQWSVPAEFPTADDYRTSIENGGTTSITGDVRTISAPLSGINTFLDHDPALRAYFQSSLPDGIERVMLTQRNGQPIVAVHVKRGSIDQVFSFMLNVEITPDKPARVKIDRIYAGQLPVPTSQVRRQLLALPAVRNSKLMSEYVDKVFTGEPLGELVLPFDGDHEVEIIGFVIDENAVRITRRVQTGSQ